MQARKLLLRREMQRRYRLRLARRAGLRRLRLLSNESITPLFLLKKAANDATVHTIINTYNYAGLRCKKLIL